MNTSTIDYHHTPDGLVGSILERKGCTLHYWLGGPVDRPVVVLIHGGSVDHRMFNPQVEALLPHYRVLVCDCRGHGQSQPIGESFSIQMVADDVLAILDHEHIEQAIIGGLSMGGMIAQELYRMAPHRISALIIFDSTPISKAYSWFDVQAMRWTVPLLRLWPYDNLRRVTANTAVLDAIAREYIYQAMGQMSKQAFMRFWKGMSLAITREGIPGHRIEVPVLLMHGDKDRNGTIVRDAAEWAQSEPNIDYVVIPDAAHHSVQDNPEAVNRALLQFLSEQTPR